MAVNDEIFKNLAQYGGGTINERVYNFLGSLGYTGTINDRLGQFEEGGRKGWQGLIKAWGQWAPAQLFSQGQQGVWYEPKPQYLYQDAAGTVPVEADGDPVGLMLDRSQGLVRGPELVANGTFDTDLSGWSVGPFVWEDGRAVDNVASTQGGLTQDLGLIAGAYYHVKADFYNVTGGTPSIRMGSGATPFTVGQGDSSVDAILVANGQSIQIQGDAATFAVDNVSVRELKGNHATQSTSAARPIYRTDGTLHWLEFDGVDDRLTSAAFSAIPQPASLTIAHEHFSSTGGLIQVGSDGVTVGMSFYYSSGEIRAYAGSGGSVASYPQAVPAPSLVSAVLFDGASSILRINGSQESAASLGANSHEQISIGAGTDGNNPSEMNYFGSIFVSGVSDFSPEEQYLAKLAGVAL